VSSTLKSRSKVAVCFAPSVRLIRPIIVGV
jgi:hypothetical protein